MKAKVFSIQGKELRDVELSDGVFGCAANDGTVYYAIRNELANLRVGTASAKTRGQVKGTSSKPWAQKGTGRARSGRRRSPVWVGGGVVFGPKPRDYSYSMPRKMKRLAMKSILSMKVQEKRLKVVEDFTIDTGKTRDLVGVLKNLVPDERTVLVLGGEDAKIKRAGRNVPWLTFLSYNRLRAHDLFYGKNVVLLETAASKLNEFYA